MRHGWLVMTIGLAAIGGGRAVAQSNVDPVAKFAWAENLGWTNWRDAGGAGEGVVVHETFLSGRIWAENAGWIGVGGIPTDGVRHRNADAADYGVNIDPNTGNLSGLAWGENIGWINFDTASLGPDRARFDAAEGRFRGYAWAENAGWLNIDDANHFVATWNGGAIPTLSEWGMAAMTLLALTVGAVVFARSRRTVVAGQEPKKGT